MTTELWDVIAKKRDGRPLSEQDINLVVHMVPQMDPVQIGAFLMACRIHGLSQDETAHLTERMAFSGESFEPAPGRVDKHSTGGVGDKMSIILAPLLAPTGSRYRCSQAGASLTRGGRSTNWNRFRASSRI